MAPGEGLELVVRGVREDDLEAVHEILMSPHVIAGSMRVPMSPQSSTRDRLTPPPGVYQLVAEAESEIAGFAEPITYPDEPRQRHSGEINMVATHAGRLRQGVGRALVEAILDLADNWLNLSRVGLIVFDGNAPARRLYEGYGFTHEGTMPRFGFRDGSWMDAHMMGRLRN